MIDKQTSRRTAFEFFLAAPPNTDAFKDQVRAWDWDLNPCSLLVSFAFKKTLDVFLGTEFTLRPKSIVLDSGAFSVRTGTVIKLADYMAFLRETAGMWDEVFSLDVIGDSKASVRNTMRLRDAGFNVMPVFHAGDPFTDLDLYLKHFNKVGLASLVCPNRKKRVEWINRCFARGWPFRFHSLGWTHEPMLARFPFQSCDSSAYLSNNLRFGSWFSMGWFQPHAFADDGKALRKCINQELAAVLRVERKIAAIWANELPKLGFCP